MNVLKVQWLALSEMMNDVEPNSPREKLVVWQLQMIEDKVGYKACMQWLDESLTNEDNLTLRELFSKADTIMQSQLYA